MGLGALMAVIMMPALAIASAGTSALAADKTLVYALYGEPDSLDSAKAEAERSNHPIWLLCDALLNISKDGRSLGPGLAESWSTSPDGLQVTLKLRAGVLFHDGTALDARAVKSSIERHYRPDHELYSAGPKNTKEQLVRELVDSIQADGLTVVMRLKHPGLHYLSQLDIISPTAAARLGRDFGRQPVCTGPFRFESWTKDKITVVANDRYWGGRPKIDRVVFTAIDEPKAVVDALVRGDAHYTPVVSDPIFFERLRDAGLNLITVPSLNVYYLGFYTDRPPFNNAALRRAIGQAVNVVRTAQFLGRGAAVPAKGPLPPAIKAYDPAISQAPYDPEAARQALAQTGHGSGLTVSLVHHAGKGRDGEIAGAIQADLRRVGVNVDLIGKPTYPDLSAAMRAREGHMFLYGWHVRAPYPERILVPLFHSKSVGVTNFTRYANPAVDRLLDEALRLPDGAEQRKAYAQAQKILVEDAPQIFLYHLTRIAVANGHVQGLEVNPGALPYDKLTRVQLTP